MKFNRRLSAVAARGLALHQRGVSLVFAMITLLALSMAAVALVRSVDTGALVLGNLSFKQDAVLASDEAARQAVDWLSSHLADTVLHNDSASNGYYASNRNSLDPTSANTASQRWIDWKSDGCQGLTSSVADRCLAPLPNAISLANGVTARYVIIRLCNGAGDPFVAGATISCIRPLNTSNRQSSEHNEVKYGASGYPTVRGLANYFRIIVRTEGGRRTVGYVDTVVHF